MNARTDGLSLAEFVAWEREQEEKHEFRDGRISYFAGGTIEHAALARELIALLAVHLRGGPFRVYGSDLLLATRGRGRYADVVVTCDERDRAPGTTIVQYPALIVEVLSDATAAIDRGEKLDEYGSIDALQEYVLIDSRKRWAEVYRRAGDGQWLASLPAGEGKLFLTSVELTLDLDELFEAAGIPG
ncbi:MAG: Uma2 family endonuclease [Candidatus Velthaea sp.]|jgi:Uma2 family endonuclease